MPYLLPFTTEMKNHLYEELETDDHRLERDAEILIQWMEKQPHLPNFKDVDFYKNILIASKNRMEKAKKHLEIYFTSKVTTSEYYSYFDTTSEEFRIFCASPYLLPLPKLTPDGQRVVVYHVDCKSNPYHLPSVSDYIRGFLLIHLIFLRFVQNRQIVIICDMENVTVSFLTLLFTTLRKILYCCSEVLPMRRSKIYVLNMTPTLQPLLNIASNFNEEYKNRFEIWPKNKTDLVEVIPRDVLPEEYGGTEKPLKELKVLWQEEMQTFNSWLAEEAKLVADLEKAPVKMKTNNDEFGIEGSFRKINID